MERHDDGKSSWPAVSFESRPWTPRTEGVSRRALREHSGPYEAAVVPRIAHATIALPTIVQAVAEEAAAELARADADLRVSGIGPLPAVLLRSESGASSQIELLTASARSLASAEIGVSAGANAHLVVANVRAMERALAHSGPVTMAALVDVHTILISSEPHHRPGIRQEQVWVGGAVVGPHRAEFIPPHHTRVSAALEDLEEFCHRADLPVVAQTAIAHAQFETIHPFTDGNGRTGRALIHMMLRDAGLTRSSTIPLSAGLLHRTEDYFAALTAYRKGDPTAIIERLAEATIFSTRLTRTLVSRLQGLVDDWRTRIRARKGATAWALADLLPAQPVITYDVVQHRLRVSAPTAFAAIDALESAGVLVPRTSSRRNRVWDAREVLEALDDFADSARRG